MEPGLVLAGFLASVQVGELSGHDRIVVLRAHQRMASHYQAQVYEDMAAVADALEEHSDGEVARQAAAAEIRVALQLARRTARAGVDQILDQAPD